MGGGGGGGETIFLGQALGKCPFRTGQIKRTLVQDGRKEVDRFMKVYEYIKTTTTKRADELLVPVL